MSNKYNCLILLIQRNGICKHYYRCGVLSEIPATTGAMNEIAKAPEYCGYLILKENGTSPFQECLESATIQADKHYNMCVSDVSLYYNTNNNDLGKAVCDNLESFALRCAEESFAVNWRTDSFCRKLDKLGNVNNN